MAAKANDMVKNPLLARAIRLVGGQRPLADAAGVRQQTISKMLNEILPVSAEVAVGIEVATKGKVTRRMLRPDLFLPLSKLSVQPPNTEAVS